MTQTPMYKGKHSDQQVNGNSFKGKKYSLVEYTALNSVQTFLYNRALFGLAVYTQEEIKEMHWEKRKRILKVHRRAQSTLNIWKQQVTNVLSSNIFSTLFPKSSLAKAFVETTEDVDPEYINKMTFKELGISKKNVIDKLITDGVLPINFYQLKQEEICKSNLC